MRVLTTIDRDENEQGSSRKNNNRSCSSGGCSGDIFGLSPGAEKEEVIRTITIYIVSGIVMIVVAYIISQILTAMVG
ncbi:hypothetical protein [Methanosalsum natronophilum]|uniref:hypothetical protein n=1 Tax=Methanosalsum natronophilum TaxID=768733 RepID=UPI00216907C4|nr:hypothetical protein [Methanosalsum natronophilum]MCS3923489.1 hypothetical protein [Methanosalsum natronophilum]